MNLFTSQGNTVAFQDILVRLPLFLLLGSYPDIDITFSATFSFDLVLQDT